MAVNQAAVATDAYLDAMNAHRNADAELIAIRKLLETFLGLLRNHPERIKMVPGAERHESESLAGVGIITIGVDAWPTGTALCDALACWKETRQRAKELYAALSPDRQRGVVSPPR